jgi:L-lactate dehydrogenase (cytochrome)/(S)-mandelate dehydrogenase
MGGASNKRIARAVAIRDLQALARKRLPKAIYDFIEGGCDDESCLSANEAAFADLRFTPRYLVDVSARDQGRSLFEHRFASAFGIAPTGLNGLYRRQADQMLLQAAAETNTPFVLSGVGTATYEEARSTWPLSWLQLYIARSENIWRRQLASSMDAGFKTLVVTVDVPASSKRERNAKRGWSLSASAAPSMSMMLDGLRYPDWTLAFLRHGFPFLHAWREFAQENANAREVSGVFTAQCPAPQSWALLADIRKLWRGNLILKGVLHPEDARLALEHGCEGVIVSNHGGRQFDRAIPAIHALPAIHTAVNGKALVMVDSGIRRGADIVAALALGADYSWVGRATLYGVIAGGAPGARRAIDILQQEVDLCMAQLGLTSLESVSRDILRTSMAAQPQPRDLAPVH